MKKIVLLLTSLSLVSAATWVNAASLLEVFHDAKQSDQTYQTAQANYLAAQTTVAQSRAALLPNLALTGSWGHNRVETNTPVGFGLPPATAGSDLVANGTVTTYALTLNQTLFNWQAFKAYDQIKLSVKQAAATYAASAQDLIMRTANAYFAVLKAQDVLRYTEVQQQALLRQLQVAKQRYQVGLDAVTSVYDAQAQYDAMRANYIAAENNLVVAKENLRTMTDRMYPTLDRLKDNFPLVSPAPADIDQWTRTAEQQNATLQAQRFAAEAAEQNIKANWGQHLPTLAATAGYGKQDTIQDNNSTDQTVTTTSYGLNLTVPLYAGGMVNAQVKQAQYLYDAAIAQMNLTHRQTISQVRQAYLGVLSLISQIEADRQAIKSAQAALASNEAGYRVGTQTILNVLTAQSTLYNAETNYASDRFNYVINTLTLKQAAGSLNENDVIAINQWLTDEPFTEPKPQPLPVYKKPVKKVAKKTSAAKAAPRQVHPVKPTATQQPSSTTTAPQPAPEPVATAPVTQSGATASPSTPQNAAIPNQPAASQPASPAA